MEQNLRNLIRKELRKQKTKIGKLSAEKILEKMKECPEEIKSLEIEEYVSVSKGFCDGVTVAKFDNENNYISLENTFYSCSKNNRVIYREIFINKRFIDSFVVKKFEE